MKKNKKNVDRREFLKLSALGLASLTILPSWSQNGVRIAPSDQVVMGFIGLGQQGVSDWRSFAGCPEVRVAAGCDVDTIKNERFKRYVERWQKEKSMPVRCDTYDFYEDLLERKDIDAVAIVTPDHWHALNTIHACQSGKDVFCQKPMGFTIAENLAMVRAVRENKRILQVGSQQRSGKEFQTAIRLVQTGAIGHIEKVYSQVGDHPAPYNLDEMPVPSNLNFNKWLGPLNDPNIHYHSDICLPVSLDPEKNEHTWGNWRYYREVGNGYTADWGAHMFDITQAALGMDGLGPVEYTPKGYNGAKFLTMKYQNGIVVTEQPYNEDEDYDAKGIKFFGTKGWIKVTRGSVTCSNPSLLEDAKNKEVGKGEYEVSSPHMQDFINSVRSRQDPNSPVEAGASTSIMCCLANIAHELGRTVKWNPMTHSFGEDKEAWAHRLYSYKYRNPYTLPYFNV